MDFFRSLMPVLALVAVLLVPPAGARAADGSPIDGIRCDQMESGVFHIHQHLALYDHGKAVTIPEDVGRPLVAACLYWIHTHTSNGIIHVESPEVRTFTLGEFFDIWGQPLTRSRVGGARIGPGQLRAYVDGARFSGDPRTIELSEHADIVLEAGPPYSTPQPFTAWNGN